MTFPGYWTSNYADVRVETYDRTLAEEMWNAAQKESWREVFQIVSDHPDWFTRDAIKLLEEARELAGAGPI